VPLDIHPNAEQGAALPKVDRSRVVLTIMDSSSGRDLFPGPQAPIPSFRDLGWVNPEHIRPTFPGPDFRATRFATVS
jgi:hypothetical protein